MMYDFEDAWDIVNTMAYEQAIGVRLDPTECDDSMDPFLDEAEHVLGWLNGATNNL